MHNPSSFGPLYAYSYHWQAAYFRALASSVCSAALVHTSLIPPNHPWVSSNQAVGL
jgi:hypothetical protein